MYERHGSPVYNLTENGIHMALFAYIRLRDDEKSTITYSPLTPDLGSYVIEQYYPCLAEDEVCRAAMSPHNKREFVFKDCDPDRKDDF